MKTLFSIIASALYSFAMCAVLWVIFHYATPWILSFGWFAVILYWIFIPGTLTVCLNSLTTFMLIPLHKLRAMSRYSGLIPMLMFMAFAIVIVVMPWQMIEEYTFLRVILALSIDGTVLALFGALIMMMGRRSMRDFY